MSDLFGTTTGSEVKPSDLGDFDRSLVEAYLRAGRTLDDLPYTDEFETLYVCLGGENCGKSRREVFHRLHNLRKAARLPRAGKSAHNPPVISRDEEDVLSSLVVQQVGSLGQRDQLPFTQRFDLVAQQFADRTGKFLGQRDVWRLIAKLAK